MKKLLFLICLLSATLFSQYVRETGNEERAAWLKKISANEFKKMQLDVASESDQSYANLLTIYNLKKERERLLGQISRLKNSDKQKTETGLMVPGGNSHYDSLFAVVIRMIEANNNQLNDRMDELKADIANLKSVLIVKIEALDKEIELLINKVSIVTINTYSESLNRGHKIFRDIWKITRDDGDAIRFAKRLSDILSDLLPVDASGQRLFNAEWFNSYESVKTSASAKVLEKIFIIIGENCIGDDYDEAFKYIMYLTPDRTQQIRTRFKEIAF